MLLLKYGSHLNSKFEPDFYSVSKVSPIKLSSKNITKFKIDRISSIFNILNSTKLDYFIYFLKKIKIGNLNSVFRKNKKKVHVFKNTDFAVFFNNNQSKLKKNLNLNFFYFWNLSNSPFGKVFSNKNKELFSYSNIIDLAIFLNFKIIKNNNLDLGKSCLILLKNLKDFIFYNIYKFDRNKIYLFLSQEFVLSIQNYSISVKNFKNYNYLEEKNKNKSLLLFIGKNPKLRHWDYNQSMLKNNNKTNKNNVDMANLLKLSLTILDNKIYLYSKLLSYVSSFEKNTNNSLNFKDTLVFTGSLVEKIRFKIIGFIKLRIIAKKLTILMGGFGSYGVGVLKYGDSLKSIFKFLVAYGNMSNKYLGYVGHLQKIKTNRTTTILSILPLRKLLFGNNNLDVCTNINSLVFLYSIFIYLGRTGSIGTSELSQSGSPQTSIKLPYIGNFNNLFYTVSGSKYKNFINYYLNYFKKRKLDGISNFFIKNALDLNISTKSGDFYLKSRVKNWQIYNKKYIWKNKVSYKKRKSRWVSLFSSFLNNDTGNINTHNFTKNKSTFSYSDNLGFLILENQKNIDNILKLRNFILAELSKEKYLKIKTITKLFDLDGVIINLKNTNDRLIYFYYFYKYGISSELATVPKSDLSGFSTGSSYFKQVAKNLFLESNDSKLNYLSVVISGFLRKNPVVFDYLKLVRFYLDLNILILKSGIVHSILASDKLSVFNKYSRLSYFFYLKNTVFFKNFNITSFFRKDVKPVFGNLMSTIGNIEGVGDLDALFFKFLKKKQKKTKTLRTVTAVFSILNIIVFNKNLYKFYSSELFLEKLLKFLLLFLKRKNYSISGISTISVLKKKHI